MLGVWRERKSGKRLQEQVLRFCGSQSLLETELVLNVVAVVFVVFVAVADHVVEVKFMNFTDDQVRLYSRE